MRILPSTFRQRNLLIGVQEDGKLILSASFWIVSSHVLVNLPFRHEVMGIVWSRLEL